MLGATQLRYAKGTGYAYAVCVLHAFACRGIILLWSSARDLRMSYWD